MCMIPVYNGMECLDYGIFAIVGLFLCVFLAIMFQKGIINLLWAMLGIAKAPQPVYMQIEPTSRCNLNCKMCFRDECPYPEGDMALEKFKQIIGGYPKLRHVHLTGFGEPFLCPDIFQMIDYAKKCNIEVEITTNGTLLTPKLCEKITNSGLDQLNISIDGIETYEKIRKVPVDLVLGGLENLIAAREKTICPLKVFINTCVLEDNKADIKNVIAAVSKYLVTVNLKTIRPGKCERTDDGFVYELLGPCDPPCCKVQYTKYEETPFCYRVWFGAFINHEGMMYPCCDLFLPVDDWNSKKFMEFRKRFKAGLPNGCEICNLTFNQKVHRYAKLVKR